MKFIFALIIFVPTIVMAAGYGGAQGANKLGEIVRIEGDVPDTIYVQKNDKDFEWKEKHSLAKECPTFLEIFNWNGKFSCIRGGQSPLAGTTYRVTTSEDYTPCDVPPYNSKSPGEVYICIEGCNNPRAPQIFYVGPWECG